MTADFTEIHQTLIARRRLLGLSQRDVAERMNRSQSAVSDFESGKFAGVNLLTLSSYADAVEADVSLVLSMRPVNLPASIVTIALNAPEESP